jgi:hypothetical protein
VIERFNELLLKTAAQLPEKMIGLIAELLSPQSIAALGAAATLTAVAQGTPFAPIVVE